MSSSICIKLENETKNTNGGWKSSDSITNWAYPGDADEFENTLDDCDFLDCTTADAESVTYERQHGQRLSEADRSPDEHEVREPSAGTAC